MSRLWRHAASSRLAFARSEPRPWCARSRLRGHSVAVETTAAWADEGRALAPAHEAWANAGSTKGPTRTTEARTGASRRTSGRMRRRSRHRPPVADLETLFRCVDV